MFKRPRKEIARVSISWNGLATDPVRWAEAREVFLRWQVEGKAHVERNGDILDLVTMATMPSSAELNGAQIVIYDPDVRDAFAAAQ